MRSRLALGLAVVLAACDSGGSSGGSPIPGVPWATFRHDNANSGAASALQRNTGTPELIYRATDDVTPSTPTIDHNGNIILGTGNGILSLDKRGGVRWTFNGYSTAAAPDPQCAVCMLGTPGCMPVGRVSAAPAVSPGNTVVFGSEGSNGRLFAIQERSSNRIDCNWVFPNPPLRGIGFRSSAALLVSSLDLSLTSVFVGADDGRLRALNSDSTERWGATASGPITASPALDVTSTTYVTTMTGALLAVSFGGVPFESINVGRPLDSPAGAPFQASPAAGTSIYAIGSAGALVGVSPPNRMKWQFRPPAGSVVTGSPAYLGGQTFSVGSDTVSDTIIYLIDRQGTAFGVRDLNGQLQPLQRCLISGVFDLEQDCRMDSCLPTGRCQDNNECDDDPDESCTVDSCTLNDQDGSCELLPSCMDASDPTQCGNAIPIPAPPATTVDTSPVLSGDQFIVVGTSDGRICARTLVNFVPGQTLGTPTQNWLDGDGCIDLPLPDPDPPNPPPEPATRSSPIIGQNGVIYVTTDAGLYEIK